MVVLLMVGMVGLFVWVLVVMGCNWSIVVCIWIDYVLVIVGLFVYICYLIYIVFFVLMLVIGIVFGYVSYLLFGVLLFVFGIWLCIVEEECLFWVMFGGMYDVYVVCVSRFVLGVF